MTSIKIIRLKNLRNFVINDRAKGEKKRKGLVEDENEDRHCEKWKDRKGVQDL